MKKNLSEILYHLIVVADYDCCLTLEKILSAKKLDTLMCRINMLISVKVCLLTLIEPRDKLCRLHVYSAH